MENYSIQIADIVVVGIVLVSTIWALIRGFVREVLGIGSWLLALFSAMYGYESLMKLFSGIGNDMMRHLVSFGVIFIGVLTTSLLITDRIARRVDDGALNSMDQMFGLLFGVLRGGVIVCLLYLIIASFSDTKKDLPEWVQNAYTLPWIDEGAKVLIGLLPESMEEDAREGTNADTSLPQQRDKSALARTLDSIDTRDDAQPANDNDAEDRDKRGMDNLIDSIQ